MVMLGGPVVILGGPVVSLGGPVVTLGGPVVTLGGPVVLVVATSQNLKGLGRGVSSMVTTVSGPLRLIGTSPLIS